MQTLTTWKQRQKVAKRQKVLTIGLLVLTFLGGIGVGHWLGYKQSKVTQVTHELESTRFDLAKAKFALEKASEIADIRNNIEAVLLKILDVYSKHSKRVEVADRNTNKNKRDKAQRERAMRWESEISPLEDQLTQLENTLAALENREPRKFDLPVREFFR